MTIEFHCPQCNKPLRTGDDKAGRAVKCPECGSTINVPAAPVRPIELIPEAPQFAGGTFTPNARQASAPIPLDAGEIISTSWAIYKSQFGLLFGAFLLASLSMVVAFLPMNLIQIGFQNHLFGRDQQALVALLGFAFWLFGYIFQMYIMAGQTLFLLKLVRGQRAEIADLFRGGRYVLRLVGNSLLFSLMATIGFFLLIVPGFIVVLMFWPYLYVLVDTDAPGIECLSRAKQITPHTWGTIFLIWLASLAFAFLGALACGIGILFTAPLIMLLLPVAYCRMTGQPMVPVR